MTPLNDDAASAVRVPRLRFPRAARLALTAEFARVREKGRPVHGKMMTLGVLKNVADSCARVGIVTSRKVGSAVVRNRVRRRLREIVRHDRAKFLDGLWLVIVAKASASRVSFEVLREEWTQLAKRGGIFGE